MKIIRTLFFVLLILSLLNYKSKTDRGYITNYDQKYMWSKTGQTFVPNYVMVDMIANQREKGNSNDLSLITEEDIDDFITEFIIEHGFNGIHVPLLGQWFHIGDNKVTNTDREIDQKTFDKLKMIITKVYKAGGSTHIWLWGDAQREQTSKSLAGGIMGAEEKNLLDEIYKQLNPLKGWTMGYGFDLWEWVEKHQLKAWHDYLWQKEDWKHLLGARASKNMFTQIYEEMDYSSYEYHKPSYNELRTMINKRPSKPSFSEDRYRIRTPSKYPKKDYNEEETLRGLWYHTMAGGVAAIWGNLDGTGEYKNKNALKCFFIFWNEKNRFKKDMIVDTTLSKTYCLTNYSCYVFYQEKTDNIVYSFKGKKKKVIAVDTKKKYEELDIGKLNGGRYEFKAPYQSDWVIWIE